MGVVGYGFAQMIAPFKRFSEAVENANMQMRRAAEELKKLHRKRRCKWVRCPWCEGTGRSRRNLEAERNKTCVMCRGKCAIRAKYARKWPVEAVAVFGAQMTRMYDIGTELAAGLGMPLTGIGVSCIKAAEDHEKQELWKQKVGALIDADSLKIEPVTGADIEAVLIVEDTGEPEEDNDVD